MTDPYNDRLHRRLTTLLALIAILAFVSGAGLSAPALIPATLLLGLGLIWDPADTLRRRLELFWRALALLLAVRAGYHALFTEADVVLPMVDLLLLLLVAETFRARDGMGEARLYALTFALLIASAAYRPGSLFAIAFVAYLAALTTTLTVGQLARQARARNLRLPLLPRGFLLQSAAYSGIALFVSLLIFLVFPRVSWGARGAPVLQHVVGFADRVSLLSHGGRLYANPEVVLRVEFPGGERPSPDVLYWRGRSYDRFDGWSWSRTSFRPHPVVEVQPWPRTRIEQLVYQAPLGAANVLFGLSPVLSIAPRSRILALLENNGDFSYVGRADPIYTAISAIGQPPPALLRAAGGERSPARRSSASPTLPSDIRQGALAASPPTLRPYLGLPPLHPRVQALADSLSAPHVNDYDRALAVQNWLRGHFRYTLDLPATVGEATLEHFLFERRAGHCEYFSTAMAVLLRAMGIPTRNVNGFLGGEWNEFGNFLSVTQNQAHSWVEVWFPGYGWVLFDPTPASVGGLAAAGGVRWWAPARFLFGSLEHRWAKWVLDYGLEDQGRLLERATDFFRREPASPAAAARSPRLGLVLLALATAVLVAGLGGFRLLAARRPPMEAASRGYLRLRRAYARAGYDHHSPPLVFLHRLQEDGAPAHAQASTAINLYAGVRFGRAAFGAAEQRLLRAAVTQIERVLRTEARRREHR